MRDDPRPLTLKQERFVIEYVATGNASEAYRRAYDAENMLPATIGREAVALMAHPTITAEIEKEKTKAFAPVRASVAWIVSQAASIAESDEAPHSARVQALSLLAKRFPDFREGIQITNNTLNLSGLTDEQLIALSEAISDSKEGN